jgi:hypothetical protein
MPSKGAKQALVSSSVLLVTGALLLANRFVELSPWVWAGFLAGAGGGAFGLYVGDRSDGLVLAEGYALWAIAGLVALVPSGLLRGGAIACYVLLAIALPFLTMFAWDRAKWWALTLAYPLLVISGAIGFAISGLVSDDLITAGVFLAVATPFFVVHARFRKQRWLLIPGGILAVLGLSFASWLPWHTVRASLIASDAIRYGAALALLVGCVWILVRIIAARGLSSATTGPESDTPHLPGPR